MRQEKHEIDDLRRALTIKSTLSRTAANWIAKEHEVVVLPIDRERHKETGPRRWISKACRGRRMAGIVGWVKRSSAECRRPDSTKDGILGQKTIILPGIIFQGRGRKKKENVPTPPLPPTISMIPTTPSHHTDQEDVPKHSSGGEVQAVKKSRVVVIGVGGKP